jgi:CBS domain containing-hemolysin-like protein
VLGTALGTIAVLTLLNGAFSLAEASLLTLRPSRIDQLVEEGRRGAVAVLRLTKTPPRYLATAQVGITLAGFAASAIAALLLTAPEHDLWVVTAVTLTLAVLTIVLGELVPKALALRAPDLWALRLAPFLSLCVILFAPLTALTLALARIVVPGARFETPMLTREEFEQFVDEGGRHGSMDEDEAKIIGNVFDLSETLVRSVMTPRIDMTAVPHDASLTDTLEAIIGSGHSRLPVYEGTVDNVVGVVHAKDLLPLLVEGSREIALPTVMRAPLFVPETRRVSDLLTEMQRGSQQMAIVQDEFAGTEGLVTIEDLLEEIVGDIRDEYDVDEPEVQVLSADESLLDGRMGIDAVNERLGIDLPHTDYDTIGGLVFGQLGHEPEPGDRVQATDDLSFVVEEIDGRRIKTLRVIRQPAHQTDDTLATP